MAVFRVDKTKDYTVMCNHHLRDKNLSLKAKGLLSLMLSLPDDWDYTLSGLACINKEKIDAIRTAVLELEQSGYITRKRIRNANGTLGDIEYTIHEKPKQEEPTLENPILDNPMLVKPMLDEPMLENPTQLNTNIQNTDSQNIDSPTPSVAPIRSRGEGAEEYPALIAKNICLDDLLQSCDVGDPERVQMIYDIICKTVCSTAKTIRVNSENMPTEVVRSVFLKLGYNEIVYVCAVLDEPKAEPIGSLPGYIRTLLYNSKNLASEYWTQKVNYNEIGGGAEKRKKKPGFNDFPQRDIDFDELERKLLSN